MNRMTKQLANFRLAYGLACLLTCLLIGFALPTNAQNNALNFDGTNDNVRTPNNASLNPSTAMTIEAWVYRTANQLGRRTLVAKWDDDGDNRGYMLCLNELVNNNNICFVATSTGVWNPNPLVQWDSGITTPLNRWVHIALTFTVSGANNIKLYVNGAQVAQTTWNFPIYANPIDLLIGGYDNSNGMVNGGASARFFQGNIDNVGIWNKVLTPVEVLTAMNTTWVGSEAGLVAYYNFNEGVANANNTALTTVNDLATTVGGTNNGTLTNFTRNGATSNWVDGKPFASGVRGNMMSFDGVDDRISISDNASLNITTNQLTLSAWVLRNSVGTFDNLIMKGSYGYGLIIDNSNRLGYWSNNLYSNCFNSGSNTIPANVWTHVAVVVNAGSSTTLYINGVNVGTSANALHTTITNNTNPLAFGVQDIGVCNCNYHGGNIDEVQIWNTARTQAQIRENMHLTLSGALSGLVAYYQFNETTGDAVDVISGNNGILQNGATRIVSEVAVAQGTSDRRTVSASLVNFTNANVTVNFTTAPADEFVAYQLTGSPFNGVNQNNIGTNTPNCYWIVRQFGAGAVAYNGMNFTLPSNNTISPTDVGTPNNLKLHRRNDAATSAFPGSFASATSANNTTKVIQFTGFPVQNSFSQFEISSSFSPLPVTLLSFGGKRTDESNVLLEWKTVSELNNEGFDIEISKNVIDFTKIGFVDGKSNTEGNTNNINNYEFNIKNSDDMYYRLKQRDFEGNSSYSNIIFVKGNENFIKIYPNPTTKNLYIDLNNWKNGDEAYFQLFDFQGKFIVGDNIKSNKTTLNIENLQKGMYMLQIIENTKRTIHKIVVY